ncbi:glycosyltransferase family 4 protein [Dictyobacter arantiisoli]|nr:glycosyltransferase family 4 protein [Dictyobacter arantiisoli]
MKIAQIAPPWVPIPPPNYGGTENVLFHLVEQQVAQGHDVTLFAPADARTSARLVSFFPHSLLQENVPWTMHLKAFYHLQKALEQVEAQDFDIVHTHLSSSADLYLFPLTAHLVMAHVTTLHSCFPFDHTPDGWCGDADTYYMDWAPSVPVVAISESARAQSHFPLNFVGVVHNGVETRQISLPPQKQGAYFVWLGRFVPEKGAHLAIEAARRADVSLILAGTIDRHVPGSVCYFSEMIQPQIDGEKVIYIGPVDAQQKRLLLGSARGLLNPINWEEPFGMVTIEAMLSCCPVISFDRGAARELIIHGKTGFLVHTLDEMVQSIARIHEIDREITRLHVESDFSARRMAERYTQIYQQVIAMNTNRAAEERRKSTQRLPAALISSPLDTRNFSAN